ncbi:MAG TPA: hypothetical protein P5522_10630, partial [Spirochaetia bacterium]|nr:hypothetical protein [Spirochaetia bacterium]
MMTITEDHQAPTGASFFKKRHAKNPAKSRLSRMHQTSTMQAPDKYEKSTIQAMLVPYYLLPITVYLLPFTVNTKMVM